MSLETSSHAIRKLPFPLLRLPYELLDTIFEYAYEDDERPGPVCRALRQFAQKRLWRDLVITTYRSLARFCRTVNSGSRLAGHIRSLNLNFARPLDVNRTAFAGRASRRLVGAKSFSSTLSRLNKLETLLMINFDGELAGVLSSADLELSALPRLRLLEVHGRDMSIADDTTWMRRLAGLREIRLFDAKYLPRAKTTPMQAVKLVLSGIDLDAWPGYNFASAFPAMRSFEASDTMVDSRFRELVLALPKNLRRLRLVNSHFRPQMGTDGSLDDVLPNFDQLESLYLCDGTFTAPRLRIFLDTANSLVSLGFGRNSPVTDAFLRSLVEGPTRLLHLRALELDYVSCGRGLTMESQGYRLSAEANYTTFHIYPGWWEPDWPVDCSEMGLLWVVHAAKHLGVTLTGSAMKAYNWEDDYHREIYDALMTWGLEVDDFKEARQFYGDEVVRDFQSVLYSLM
ncbi:hypothetical protein RTBOTA2_004913 [Rhodotorula toruloides]|uniref:F-box domain-containing protein n=1 Tax=Rhodotorula toruloides TaxID=5286 RepID=A0A2T0ACQ7_RHOTO|nr:hypothetical protein RTBOTA2_004913 [Rhodotorula toruloides]PRQ75789.1 hypothetical protein AAT19DRAFT_12811 [Rhodotorula toruloides]